MTIVQLPSLPHAQKFIKLNIEIMLRFNVCLHVWHVLQNWNRTISLQFWKAIKLTFFSIYENSPLPAAETSRKRFYLLTIDTTINNNGKDFIFRVDHRSNTFPFITSTFECLLMRGSNISWFLKLKFYVKVIVSCTVVQFTRNLQLKSVLDS